MMDSNSRTCQFREALGGYLSENNDDYKNLVDKAKKGKPVLAQGGSGVGKTAGVMEYLRMWRLEGTACDKVLLLNCESEQFLTLHLQHYYNTYPSLEPDRELKPNSGIGDAVASLLSKLNKRQPETGRAERFFVLFDDVRLEKTQQEILHALNGFSLSETGEGEGVIFLTTKKLIAEHGLVGDQIEKVTMTGLKKEVVCAEILKKIPNANPELVEKAVKRSGTFPIMYRTIVGEATRPGWEDVNERLRQCWGEYVAADDNSRKESTKALDGAKESVDRVFEALKGRRSLGRALANVLCFFNKNGIPRSIVYMACEMIFLHKDKLSETVQAEIQAGLRNNKKQRLINGLVKDFFDNLIWNSLAVSDGNTEKKRMCSLEGVVMQVFLDKLDDEDNSMKDVYFGIALEALVRVFPTHPTDDKCCMIPHALKIEAEFVRDSDYRIPLVRKVQMMQLYTSMAFWYLLEQWDAANGYEKLERARKTFCLTFDEDGGNSFCKYPPENWCPDYGDELYNTCVTTGATRIQKDPDTCSYIKSLPQYQLLHEIQKQYIFRERTWGDGMFNDHLSESGYEEILARDERRAPDDRIILQDDKRIEAFLAEAVANTFFIDADMISNALYFPNADRAKRIQRMKIALKAGLIAKRMYERLCADGIRVKKGIINVRSVGRLKVKLLRTKFSASQQLSRDDLDALCETLREFDDIKSRTGNTYEDGLLFSRLDNSNHTNQLRCKEGEIYVLGAFKKFEFGPDEHQRSIISDILRRHNCEQLIREALEFIPTSQILMPNKQAFTTHMRIAEYYFDSRNIDQAIDYAIRGMNCYSNHLSKPSEYVPVGQADGVLPERPEIENEDPHIMKYGLTRLNEYYNVWEENAGVPARRLQLSEKSVLYLRSFKDKCSPQLADGAVEYRFKVIVACLESSEGLDGQDMAS